MSEVRLPRKEPKLSDDLYLRFRDLLQTRCGLFYPEHKRNDLAYSLQAVLESTGHPDLAALCADAITGEAAWEAILAQLTIGETYFFRNSAQFDALRQHIFPEIIARRTMIQSFRMWSAGCATGEEPYSLAMAILDLLAEGEPWHTTILATDINPTFLARAREALYGEWSFRETPATLRDRFFHQEGSRWRLSSAIRRMVTFARLNLAEPCYPSVTTGTSALDLIICRNVTIYFDAATTQQVVGRFFDALTPGGWLIVGHAEPQASIYRQFEVHNFPDTIVYRKPLNAPLFVSAPQSSAMTMRSLPLPAQSAASTTIATAQSTSSTSAPVPRPNRNAGSRPDTNSMSYKEEPKIALVLALARKCADRGEWAAAEEHCTLALEQDPLCINAHYLLGQIHEHQGRLDTALVAYRRTVYLDRCFVLGMLGMASIWRQIGYIANARRSYQNALQYLERLPSDTPIPGADGGTAGALIALVTQYIQMLG
jgi:chemotaxis protein methyltransferase CheR